MTHDGIRFASLVLCLACPCVLAAACGGTAKDGFDLKGARAGSGFAGDAEGWTITGDAQADRVEADYDGTGGNPDGLISAVDDVTGGIWYFQAPAKYLGDASAAYGRFLTFDLKTTYVYDPFDSFDVILAGAGKVLVFNTPINPATDRWTSSKVPLKEASGWAVIGAVGDSYPADFSTLPAPSEADVRAVLGDVDQLLIRGEFNTGPDTGFLDNVRFGAKE